MSHQGRDRRWCRWTLRRQKRLVAGKGQPESNLARPDWRISIVSFGTLVASGKAMLDEVGLDAKVRFCHISLAFQWRAFF
jgi:hypothetical protein